MILATGPVPSVARALLGEIVVAGPGKLDALLPQAEVLIVRGGTYVSAEMLAAAPRLRVIGRSGVGFSEVDVAAATARGIPVVLAGAAGARAVAEGALTLALALLKRLPELDEAVHSGRWEQRDAVEIRDLAGATLGVVGFGRIGRELSGLAGPLGLDTVFHDPYVDGSIPLEELFARADVVSLHAPLTEETRGLVGPALLGAAKPGLILVNLARGGLVSSLDDLLAGLESGGLGGVGLDVFDPEPPDPAHPLFRHPRVLCSPHALWRTPSALDGIFREMAEGVLAALAGDRPAAVANPELYA